MNKKLTVAGTEWNVFTETNEKGTLYVFFESGVVGTKEYNKTGLNVRDWETVEEIEEKMIKQIESSAAYAAYREEIRSIPKEVRHLDPRFRYFRRKCYGIAMYFADPWSPTGVSNMGGYSEEEFAAAGLANFGVAQRNDF
jgi:hypothetical protein